MDDQITAAGQKLLELFVACATDPDSLAVGQAADDALDELEALLSPEAL